MSLASVEVFAALGDFEAVVEATASVFAAAGASVVLASRSRDRAGRAIR